jgi:hypothetical protein
MQRGQAQGVAGGITTNQPSVVWIEKRQPQNKHTISKHNSCGQVITHLTTCRDLAARVSAQGQVGKRTKKIKGNNHKEIDHMIQAGAI